VSLVRGRRATWHPVPVTTDPTQLPPAGWYQDPSDARAQRWWAGTAWTAHVVYPEAQVNPQLPVQQIQSPNVQPQAYSTAVLLQGQQRAIDPTVVAPPQGRWGLWDIGWEALFFLGSLILTVIIGAGVALTDPNVMSGGDFDYQLAAGAWLLVILQGLSMIGMVGWPLIAAWFKGDGWRKSYGFVVNGRAWLVGGVGGVVTFGTMLVLTGVMSSIVGEPIDSAAGDAVSQITGTPLAYATFLAFIAVGAPFVEEILFRGLLWGAIVKRGWSPWLATGVSGVLFGLAHAEPLRALPLIAAGLLLGMIRHYAGLSASMFAHCIVNTIGVVALLLSP
jgi:uncharacterized protein